jgi:hypothetical protein
VIKKKDNNSLFKVSKNYQMVLNQCIQFLKNNYKEKNDTLVLEILLYIIDYFRFLMNFQNLHTLLKSNEIIFYLVEMLQIHDNLYIVRSLTQAILEATKITIFYPDLLNDNSLNIIIKKMLNKEVPSKSLESL